MSEIESTLDENITKTEKMFLALAERLEKIKKNNTGEMFSNLKKGKEKLQREKKKFDDSILCVDYCETSIEQAKGSEKVCEATKKFITAEKKSTDTSSSVQTNILNNLCRRVANMEIIH